MTRRRRELEEPPLDRLGRQVQGAFGAVFGVGLGFLLAWRWEVRDAAAFLLLLAGTALAGGAAAARWGDRFWHWLAGNHRLW